MDNLPHKYTLITFNNNFYIHPLHLININLKIIPKRWMTCRDVFINSPDTTKFPYIFAPIKHYK